MDKNATVLDEQPADDTHTPDGRRRARTLNVSRARVRLAHIGIAAFTAGVAYSPSFDAETVRELLRLVILPGLTVTGGSLWALPKLRRLARRDARRGATIGA